ncbi:MAG: GxxExxY protein [Saprospiraceae bacterium]|nr:GxxExxY protein [Saprospiraceae bacterium]
MHTLAENKLSREIIGACIEIHRELGPGLLESIYEEALCFELNALGLCFERQKQIPVTYKGHRMNLGFRADVIVEDLVLVELKSVEEFSKAHPKIVLSYLRLTDLKLGLLINFNEVLLKDGIKRIVNDL